MVVAPARAASGGVDLVVAASDTAASQGTAKQLVSKGAVAVSALYIVDWLCNPKTGKLDRHVLLGIKRPQAVAAAETARSSMQAAQAPTPEGTGVGAKGRGRASGGGGRGVASTGGARGGSSSGKRKQARASGSKRKRAAAVGSEEEEEEEASQMSVSL